MTDRHPGVMIVFDEDIRADTIEMYIAPLIKQIRGVADVIPVPPSDMMEAEIARARLKFIYQKKIINMFKQNYKDV